MQHRLEINRKDIFVPCGQYRTIPGAGPTPEGQAAVAAAIAARTRAISPRPIPPGMVAQQMPPPTPIFITPGVDSVQLARIESLRGRGRGKSLVIVANGPSILEVDLPALVGVDGIDIMSINKPDPRIWPTTYWSFCDACVWRRYEDLWNSYGGTIIVSTGIDQVRGNSVTVKALYGDGFSLDLSTGYHIGHSTVFASLQVAVWMDYTKVYVFGVDMAPLRASDGTMILHFYGTNPDVDPEERVKRFGLEAKHYDSAAELLSPELRARLVFCSAYNPFGFPDKFVRLDHRAAIAKILS